MSASSENIVFKQPIKHLEIPINKFNDVAIPHHLELLRQHKNNVEKFQKTKEWDRVYREQMNASRLVKQLKQLLYEMDMLRCQVLDSDIMKFDRLTTSSRESTIDAIKTYLEMEIHIPLSSSSFKEEDQIAEDPLCNLNAQMYAEEEKKEEDELERQQACLDAWNSLQDDMRQLQQLFADFNHIVLEQKQHVNFIEDNVETVDADINKGMKFLEKAAKYKTAAYPVAGALIGTCMGGPIGLIAGIKLGGLTAIGCGVLGFTGGALLEKRLTDVQKNANKMEASLGDRRDVRQSTVPPFREFNDTDAKKDL